MKTAKHLLPLGLALGAAGMISCSIPKPDCTVSVSNVNGAGLTGAAAYAVQLKLVSGTGPCAELKGDVVGMQAYHPPAADDPQVRDLGKTSIAIRTQTHGLLSWMNEDFGFPTDQDQPNAIGDFAVNEPDANDFCQVSTTAEARVNFPGAQVPEDTGEPCTDNTECDAGPGGECTPVDPMDPAAGNTCVITYDFEATDLTYRWSNLQFYVTAAATGSQFTADLEVVLNGCTAQYKAIGMWPAVDCTHLLTGEPEVLMCHPDADPNNPDLPRLFGSGINPDFGPVVCDPNFGTVPAVDLYNGGVGSPHCVLGTETIPALDGFPTITPVP